MLNEKDMKKYKHKKTGVEVTLNTKDNMCVGLNEIVMIPAEIVENSNDWELVGDNGLNKFKIIEFKDSAGNKYWRKSDDKFTINLQYNYTEENLLNRELKIYGVKRISDSQVFRVGDKVVWDWVECAFKFFTIKEIYIEDGKFRIKIMEGNGDYGIEKMILSHYQPEVLCQTYDGYNIYEGDRYYALHKDSFLVIDNCTKPLTTPNDYLAFKSKDALHEYIILNKPCLSINDIAKVYVTANRKNPRRDCGWEKQAEQLIDIVTDKLKL